MYPEICPILALGMYWATYGVDSQDAHLFPGSNQYDRFRKILGRVLSTPSMVDELAHRGTSAENIGTHSMRKGAATYCASGSTAGPSAIAVHLRAGWAMGGVTDRYLRHDAASDMHVGRTVCGLPSDKPEFATLPPQFRPTMDAVATAKRVCFSGLPDVASGVAEFALASLIHHHEYLRAKLSSSHPLFQNPVLKNAELVSQLRDCLVVEGETTIVATGIPPYVAIMTELKAVNEALLQQQAAIHQQQAQETVVQRMMPGMTSILEERAVDAGVPTYDRLAATVMRRLEDIGLMRLIVRLDSDGAADEAPAIADSAPDTHDRRNHRDEWAELTVLFPPNYTLPNVGADQAWIYWCCGDSSPRTPPLRRLQPAHLPIGNQRKRLSESDSAISSI